ncbi:MAG: glycosyltransferase family protein [Candidatus Thorarchaeota archaeon]|nr:glycosyltransferase family protein [Candidatus Thorarchaeota archaeon]
MTQNIVCIVQARMNSSRLPKKSLKKIGSWSIVELVLKRASQAHLVNKVILATSTNPSDDPLAEYVRDLGFAVFRGSEDDVLSRFFEAAKSQQADVVVRVTGDCPVISPKLIDYAVVSFLERDVDYLTISIGENKECAYPRGFDVEVAKFESLAIAASEATEKYEREHVMPYLYTHQENFTTEYLFPEPPDCRPRYRLCVDTETDYRLILAIYDHFKEDLINADHRKIIEFLDAHPEIATINSGVKQKHFKEVDTRMT